MKRTAFVLDVTDEDALDIWFDVEAGVVVAFCVNHRALIREEWKEVVRYDTAHGRLHVHRFDGSGQERVEYLEDASRPDYTSALNAALRDLVANWRRYRRLREGAP